ncbi:uncharacterized protein LOC101887782 [Musca domestica]|uniref:Uncharacterized protein LOC101887782 n=1 Tax=Musca domestica TaxID=7370 RepID=A0A1I8NHI6_MUSDO|nr:uncharacterized protein LOC101887782 [Musca domestica]
MEHNRKFTLPDEALKIQRVDIYLQDLKDRLNELRLQHNAVIRNSEDIINEIDEVSSTLLLVDDAASDITPERMTKIRKLIHEFEKAKDKKFNRTSPQTPETKPHVNIKKILENFEKLNDSHLLQDSLQLFRRAKESLDRIDYFLQSPKDISETRNLTSDIRHKINIFSYNKNESRKEARGNDIGKCDDGMDVRETISNYVSCCSSLNSISKDHDHSGEFTNSLNGYEGDNDDSEFDVFAANARKK